MRYLEYLGEQLNNGRQGQGSTEANPPFRLIKGLSHQISQIFRPTTCTLIGVASWDMSSLSAVLYSSKSDFSKHKKGLSHEIFRIFSQRACTLVVWPA
jgi:hypothetical protein